MNANFTEDGIYLTLTYAGKQPSTREEAMRDMQA